MLSNEPLDHIYPYCPKLFWRGCELRTDNFRIWKGYIRHLKSEDRENLFISWIHPSIFCRVCGSGLVQDSVLEHASRDHCVSTAVELRRWSDWTKRCQIQMRGGNKKLILTWWRHKSSSARLYHTEITRITDALYSNELWTKSYVGLKLLSLFTLRILKNILKTASLTWSWSKT